MFRHGVDSSHRFGKLGGPPLDSVLLVAIVILIVIAIGTEDYD